MKVEQPSPPEDKLHDPSRYESFMQFVIEPLFGWLRRNVVAAFLLLGVLMITAGALLSVEINSVFSGLPVASVILMIGSALIGAGVFTSTTKSAQFTELFREHIRHVIREPSTLDLYQQRFISSLTSDEHHSAQQKMLEAALYRPETGLPEEAIVQRWHELTSARLREVLPTTYKDASDRIHKAFLTDERHYHFENYETRYIIEVQPHNLKVRHIVNTKVVLAPSIQTPILKQWMETEGNFELISINLGNQEIDVNGLYREMKNHTGRRQLQVALRDFPISKDQNGSESLFMERVTEYTQPMPQDPMCYAFLDRYVKGATVRGKISSGYELKLESLGDSEIPDSSIIEKDGEGFKVWKLALDNELLLPGQGYILLAVPVV